MERARTWLRTPVGRGYVLVAITTAAFGFAMAAHQNIVANYFENVLGLSGPEFGYITAIREIPGFLLIFLTAIFYRLSLQQLTAGALLLLAVGFAFFGVSNSFWSVAPWVIISSMGYHTWLQTQPAFGMSLTTEKRSGSVLGRLSAISSAGALAAMLFVLVAFHFAWLDFRAMFAICGLMAFVGAVAIFFFPHLRDGQAEAQAARRQPIVLRWEYRYYYLLNLLDGGRQQIFFSFGLWVLVHRFGLTVPAISAVLLGVTTLSMVAGSWIGRLIDRHGERQMLAFVNVAYVIALVGYAVVDNVILAILCYVIYSFIFPLSTIGAATYLRKVAAGDEVAPSLAMGLTMQHVAAIVVPLATGYVLNYVGYQVPFLVASAFAGLTFLATRRLSPETQKSARRQQQEDGVSRQPSAVSCQGLSRPDG